jgi:hypothetical protein
VSGTLTGVTRELILTGLAGGDNKALAGRTDGLSDASQGSSSIRLWLNARASILRLGAA